MRSTLLTCALLLLSSCAPDDLDDRAPDALAQRATIDGSVRITPSGDAAADDPGADDPGADAGTDDDVDAGANDPVPVGETVKLPDGGVIYLDESCPSRDTLFGAQAVGCCRYRKCGLSNHTLDFPGVSRECQSYDQVKELDTDFNLAPKACKFGPAP